ncbi:MULTISPECIES: nitroreductase family protein [Comamonas]|uniref:nitroreductase family protein n=1 Tax=Comamonas TaxID=283 RepID=UPI00050DA267|nr:MULTISPECIES: nitroreductase family protein [Comamonas]KGG91698.1 nitroreductase [Comamonas thiooxydans]KGH02469.1 NAD(P)H-flavin oxidoreductase [Comamonas thiooxydans]KGH03154.1 nitroreductase [Comamonas thiooxydans]KGH11764.1 nitroreductase [Comamonas thiooxydans]TZG10137.1 nitroreductase [Comamonas thiooxydans]
MSTTRSSTVPVHTQFIERMSPRAFVPEALSAAQIEQLVEAARWAPSASNKQPWHFAYALRDDANWQAFSQIPNEANRRWCLNGGALIVLLSDRQASAAKHSFDAGCAWGYLALQAHAMGLATHAMGGFSADEARKVLNLPEHLVPECVIAVGRRADAATLPDDLREREQPSGRKQLAEMLSAGAVQAAATA